MSILKNKIKIISLATLTIIVISSVNIVGLPSTTDKTNVDAPAIEKGVTLNAQDQSNWGYNEW